MANTNLTHLSSFLSTLFNIPHECLPVEVEENDDTAKEPVRGETINDIELGVQVIMQEMSAAKVQVGDKEEEVTEPVSVMIDMLQVPPPASIIDLSESFTLAREKFDKVSKNLIKCEVKILRMDFEQLAKVAVENGVGVLLTDNGREVLDSEYTTDADDTTVADYQNVDVNDECHSSSNLALRKCGRKVIKKCGVRIRRMDIEQLERVAVENGVIIHTDREVLESGVVHKVIRTDAFESGCAVEETLRVLSSKTTEYSTDVDDQTEYYTGLDDEAEYNEGVDKAESTTDVIDQTICCSSAAVTPNKGGTSCHSQVRTASADVCWQLAIQIRDEYISKEDMVVMDVDKESARERITVSDDEDFVDFLKFCKREDKTAVDVDIHDDKEDAYVSRESSDKHCKKKIVKKISSLKSSVKCMFKSVVNKVSVFKHKKLKSEKLPNLKIGKEVETNNNDGKKMKSDMPKSTPSARILQDKKRVKFSSTEGHGGKRQREFWEKVSSLPSKKLKIINNSSTPYSNSHLANFFNPVQPVEDSSPLFKIPKLVTEQAEGTRQEDKPQHSLSQGGVQGRLARRVLPRLDVRDHMVRLDGKVISLGTFLRKEGIVPEINIEQFMFKDTDMIESEQFSMLYNKFDVAREDDSVYIVQDSEEVRDIYHEDWEMMRRVTSDKERKKMASSAFKNCVSSNPGSNLTFHGYRSNDQLDKDNGRSRLHTRRNLTFGSFVINCGLLEPLPGYKRKRRQCQENVSDGKRRNISFADFYTCMKSQFFKKYESAMRGGKLPQLSQFQDYLNHYKAGQEETENFLAFYSNKKGIELEESMVDEILDIETVLGRYKMFYGDADPVFCDRCSKRHLFCQ